ncbi:MAG: Smr/MutS family protein [Candidatus Riflebacteria bacterium]|nr:Smr/MutS family protein [Candidatus Riflebacteria bacterium]
MNFDSNNPIEIPINGELDLHTFQPREIKNLVVDYLNECLKKEIYQIRIIHGKGIGNLRRTVHSLLTKIDFVESFNLAPENAGSWGATIVKLRKKN